MDALDALEPLPGVRSHGRRSDTPRRPRGVRPDRARAARRGISPVRRAHVSGGARNQAVLALLSDCGLRRDELCIINEGDVNLTDMQVRIYAPKTPQPPVGGSSRSRRRPLPCSQITCGCANGAGADRDQWSGAVCGGALGWPADLCDEGPLFRVSGIGGASVPTMWLAVERSSSRYNH